MSLRNNLSFRVLSLFLVATAGLCAFAWSQARESAAASSASTAESAAGGNDAIAHAMQQMNDALKALGKGVTAENRAAMLEELSKFESALISAKSQTPASAAKVDEKKRAAFVSDFRHTLVDTLKLAADAEALVLEAKYKDADTLIRNKLGGMKSTGHGKFKEEGGK